MRACLVAAIMVTTFGCRDGRSPPRPEAAPPLPDAIVVGVPQDADPLAARRFDCQSDDDCVNSCHWGAVSRAWYDAASRRAGFPECFDGCNNQLSAAPRCEQGGCVAYQRDPRDASKLTRFQPCTRRDP